MKSMLLLRVIFCLLLPAYSYSQSKDNEELKKMYAEDQGARQVANINWYLVSKADSLREKRVYELIDSGKLVTGKDYYNSAMIFQHGRDSVAHGMAVKQMRKAIELDSTIDKWLLAAAIDRDLMSRNRPQIYGTQYVKHGADGKWQRYTIDTSKVNDAERKYYGVETLQEQLVKEQNMNLLAISDYYEKSKSVSASIDLIKREKSAGEKSLYNVSEGAVNQFGYELLQGGKANEAVEIFTLNTMLYPKGYNTFDSLGECLLGMGRKMEALKAYKRSLELNPKNENAKAIIAANQ